jgi:hypothetical protein
VASLKETDVSEVRTASIIRAVHDHIYLYLKFKLNPCQHGFTKSKLLFFPVPVCAITASGMPGGTFVSMNRFSTLCG